MPNVAKLERLASYLRDNRGEHDQREWAMRTPCGTTYCAAGTTVLLEGYPVEWVSTVDLTEYRDGPVGETAAYCYLPAEHPCAPFTPDSKGHYIQEIAKVAAHTLDLDPLQVHALFYGAKTFEVVEQLIKEFCNEERVFCG